MERILHKLWFYTVVGVDKGNIIAMCMIQTIVTGIGEAPVVFM